ncbi:MAG TPA: PhzF family phenazine biosynthesis protein [Blastocatellia bacterium]|nr:PhzF family phenazine biosynthesis protein [Blastocatellia bacterium]
MKSYKVVIADVFTERRFGGNQLAVFTDARGLETGAMQDIAREMNYSETTFLLPAESQGDFRLRIFTPARELPFAGHPIVGSAYVVVAEGLKNPTPPLTAVRFETGVGLIDVDVRQKRELEGGAIMTQPLPEVKATIGDHQLLATALGIKPGDITGAGLPTEVVFNGITVVIVPVVSLKAVQSIRADMNAIGKIADEYGADTMMAVTRETIRTSSTAHCRVFAPAAGVGEDPATGSANGPLGSYLYRHGVVSPGADGLVHVVSEQGHEMNRPSTLYIDLTVDHGKRSVKGVRVGGGVVIAGRGEIYVE